MATSATAEQTTLFVRIINMGKDPQLCMKFMALWMWLESSYQGFEELVRKISSRGDDFITSVLAEAEAVLSSLDLCSSGMSNSSSSSLGMKYTLSLSKRFLSVSAIIGDKDEIYRGIAMIYNEVCCVIFKDALENIKIKGSLIEEKKVELVPSKLNPFAKAWSFASERGCEEDRCLYATFSNGYPLTENQIYRFFSLKFGKCVERVYVHWPADTRMNNLYRRRSEYLPALFAKVVFDKSSIPAMILTESGNAKFYIDQKPLWCKKYEPNKKRSYSFSG